VPTAVIEALGSFGLSSICNVVASIKLARQAGLGADDVIVTVATDGAGMYSTELERVLERDFGGTFDERAAAATFGEALLAADSDHVLELTQEDRRRIFNLGYYTWVEQQGVPIEEFVERREQRFWTGLRELVPVWDAMIEEFNARVGAAVAR
jgi:hypothetical protein